MAITTFTLKDTVTTTSHMEVISGDSRFIYVAAYSEGIRVYEVSDEGILTLKDFDVPVSIHCVWADENFVYATSDTWATGGLFVYQVSEAGILSLKDYYAPLGLINENKYDIYGDGNFIYIAMYDAGVYVFSISELGIVTFVTIIDIVDDMEAERIWGDGTYIYIATETGIHSYTVTALAVVTHIDYLPYYDGDSEASGIFGDSRFVYVETADYFHIFEVSEAGIITTKQSYDDGGEYELGYGKRVFIDDNNHIFISKGSDGLKIIEVDGNGGISSIFEYDVGSMSVYDMWKRGNYLFVADGSRGLKCFYVIETSAAAKRPINYFNRILPFKLN